MRRLIIFLLCKRLGIKTYEPFQFVNQRSTTDRYYFTEKNLMKVTADGEVFMPSKVSLNWLLDDECEIVRYDPL